MKNSGLDTIKFDTSGLRGIIEDFTPSTVRAYIYAFLQSAGKCANSKVFVGTDLRQSSPHIAAMAMAAIASTNKIPVFAGNVPTPALESVIV